ncbi:hypothetical protein Vadar_018809 [Vaccinium darrowii]|uniref:Uncharacterized protein n=1 Tax=Vaccinium darrowii TaxID=229202 RepID=A0ACB7Z5D0_9ERIC|nr:hypothetical protein Vadar_018809 [Vaccinium darrowii]
MHPPVHTITLDAGSEGSSDYPSLILVGKIWSTKTPNWQGVQNIINKAWKTRAKFTISRWNNGYYAFSFELEEDVTKILAQAPWSISGNLLVLTRWDQDKSVEELDFTSSPFWIQVHGLPLSCMSRKNGGAIARIMGFSIEPETNTSFEANKTITSYLRLRVRIDITKPLNKGFFLKRSDLWVRIQYERLSDFCYACGRIGHTLNKCKEVEAVDVAKLEFGSYLRAETPLLEPHFPPRDSVESSSSSEKVAMESGSYLGAESPLLKPHFPPRDSEESSSLLEKMATEFGSSLRVETPLLEPHFPLARVHRRKKWIWSS